MNDLREERDIIKDIITSSGNVPVMSEMTIDIHNPPRQAGEKQIETCDCYIGVFHRRWGYVPSTDNPEKLSITAIEYEKARELGLPRLVLISSAEKEPELQNFLDNISRFGTGDWRNSYNNLVELAIIVSQAISRLNVEESKKKSLPSKNNMESDREIFNAANTLVKLQARESESAEVSYTVLDNIQKEDPSIILQKIASAVNVQLTLADGEEEIPFVPFDGFNNAIHEDKVYLYGTSGSGKSRTIFEIIKSKVTSFERIFIINPRNIIMGAESGRIDIYELAYRLTEADAILWDNFPDDLVKKDTDSACKVIEIISSKNVKILLVALKPKYLEFYRDIAIDVPELYKHQLNYDKDKFRSIVKLYGINTGFKQLYEKYVAKDLGKISRILWEKEPTPLTLLDYYKELSSKESQRQYNKLEEEVPLNAVVEAENLLRRTQYYGHQFDYISSVEERRTDAEFLYTLRLCYELGRDRTISTVEELQKGIFNSEPPRQPSRNLSTWVYLSGQYYAMHDAARQSIRFDDYVKMQVMRYLTNNFLKIVPKEKNQVYSFAVFFGKNFQYISRDESRGFLPAHIYEYMKSNRYFENCIGYGIGESFPSLDDELQQSVLNRLGVDTEFAEGFGYSLGLCFSSLDDDHRQEIFKRIYSGMPFSFAWLFGESLGRIFSYLSEDVKREIFEQIPKNVTFALGIGRGLGYTYASLDSNLQQEVFERAKTNSEVTFGLGAGLGKNFSSLSRELQIEILERSEKNHMFDQGLGLGFGYVFEQSTKEFQVEIFQRAEKRISFTFGLGMGIGSMISYSSEDFREELLERAEKGEFAIGLGIGAAYFFNYLSVEWQKKMFEQSERNKKFSYGLGCGFGVVFNFFPKEMKFDILARANKNIEFDQGLGFGIGITFTYLAQDLQEEMFERAEKDGEFAYGLGCTLGYSFTFLPIDLQTKILKQSEKNKDLMIGLGSGAAYSFTYQTEGKQLEIFEKIDHDADFAKGLGIIFGRNFRYFPTNIQNKIFEKVEDNALFAYGWGYGVGHVFSSQAEDLQKEIFEMANKNPELSLGLGHGLGYTLLYLGKYVQKEIFERAEYEPEFAYGLSYGLGRSKYLPKETKNEMTTRFTTNIQLAIGFGDGIGSILFKYFSKEEQEEIFQNAIAARDSGFSRGIGTGIGRTFKYLDRQQQEEVLRKADENDEFAIGLGLGLGSIFKYLNRKQQEEVLREADEQSHFEKGFTSGIAYIFKYLSKDSKTELFEKTLNQEKGSGDNSTLAQDLGLGLGHNFPSLKEELQAKILKVSEQDMMFASALGQGLPQTFQYLDKELQGRILALADKNQYFSKVFQEVDTTKMEVPRIYNDFPIIGSHSRDEYASAPYTSENKNVVTEEVSFSGLRENYCICYIDMMNSTKIAAELTAAQISKYYSIFLNSMATIVRNFGGKIIKSAGDALIYYFPDTVDSSNISAFKDVLECGITMIAAHRAINSRMQAERLPSLNYRISADYGMVAVAKSKSSQTDDLFGSAMNVGAKINSKAPANGMVIGEDLYQLVKSLEDFSFERVKEQSDTKYSQYPAYIVQTKQKRNILNPFKRVSESRKEG